MPSARSLLTALLGSVLALSGTGLLAQEEPRLSDVILADTDIVIAIDDLDRLEERGEALLKKYKLQRYATIAELSSWALSWLGIKEVTDRTKPIAVTLPGQKITGVEIDDGIDGTFSFLATRFSLNAPLPDAAEKLGVTRDGLTLGRASAVGDRFVLPRTNETWIGRSRGNLEKIVRADRLSLNLARAPALRINNGDVLLGCGQERWKEFWRHSLDEFLPGNANEPGVSSDAAEKLITLAELVRFASVTGRLEDDAVAASMVAVFDPTRAGEINAMLAELRGGFGASHVYYLPDDKLPLFAAGVAGSGRATRIFVEGMLLDFASQGGMEPSEAMVATIRKGLDRFWTPLRGLRMAAYRDADTTTGTFLLMADLDGQAALDALPELIAEWNAHDQWPVDLKLERGDMVADQQVLNLTIEGELPEFITGPIQASFGDDWRTIRLATGPDGDGLVMCLGTDPTRLAKTLENLRDGRLGLGKHPVLKSAMDRMDPNRIAEFHFSVAQSADYPHASDQLSSAAVIADGDHIAIDWWYPGPEAKAFLWIMGYRGDPEEQQENEDFDDSDS
jgi:hypothetical protein